MPLNAEEYGMDDADVAAAMAPAAPVTEGQQLIAGAQQGNAYALAQLRQWARAGWEQWTGTTTGFEAVWPAVLAELGRRQRDVGTVDDLMQHLTLISANEASKARRQAADRAAAEAEAQAQAAQQQAAAESQIAQWRAEARAAFVGSDAEFAQSWPAMLSTIRQRRALEAIGERLRRKAADPVIGYGSF